MGGGIDLDDNGSRNGCILLAVLSTALLGLLVLLERLQVVAVARLLDETRLV